jgi:ligand-binding sensor protein
MVCGAQRQAILLRKFYEKFTKTVSVATVPVNEIGIDVQKQLETDGSVEGTIL